MFVEFAPVLMVKCGTLNKVDVKAFKKRQPIVQKHQHAKVIFFLFLFAMQKCLFICVTFFLFFKQRALGEETKKLCTYFCSNFLQIFCLKMHNF